MKTVFVKAVLGIAMFAHYPTQFVLQAAIAKQQSVHKSENHQHREKFVFMRNGIQGFLVLEGRGIWRETSADGYNEQWKQVFDCEAYIEMEFAKNKALKYRVYRDHIMYKGHGKHNYIRDGEGYWMQ
jgi:hypothetical protein